MERVITNVSFDPQAITLTYMSLPADLRENGLACQHQLTIPAVAEYEDEMQALLDAVRELLEDALEDVERVPEYVPPDEDEDDDDEDEDD